MGCGFFFLGVLEGDFPSHFPMIPRLYVHISPSVGLMVSSKRAREEEIRSVYTPTVGTYWNECPVIHPIRYDT